MKLIRCSACILIFTLARGNVHKLRCNLHPLQPLAPAGTHMSLCRYVFQTDTKYTLSMSGTGHSGMEACIANLVEPGETVVVGNAGIWGMRVADLAARYGAKVVEMKVDSIRAFTYEEIKANVEEHKPALLFLCQGESSVGAPPLLLLYHRSSLAISRSLSLVPVLFPEATPPAPQPSLRLRRCCLACQPPPNKQNTAVPRTVMPG